MPENTVKVDRTTGYGNPFPITKGTETTEGVTKPVWMVGTWEGPALWFRDTKPEAAELAVNSYRAWITQPAQQNILDRAKRELRGKNLACWCPIGSPCHAEVLLELANSPALAQQKQGER
jgi:hypothetical protein